MGSSTTLFNPSPRHQNKSEVLRKILALARSLTPASDYEKQKTEVFPAWLSGQGKKFKEGVYLFDENLKNLLTKYAATELYKEALVGENPRHASGYYNFDLKKGLSENSVELLSDFFDRFPEILEFFITTFCNKVSLLEQAHFEFWEEYDRDNGIRLKAKYKACQIDYRAAVLASLPEVKLPPTPNTSSSSTTEIILMTQNNSTPVKVSPEAYKQATLLLKRQPNQESIHLPLTMEMFAAAANTFIPSEEKVENSDQQQNSSKTLLGKT